MKLKVAWAGLAGLTAALGSHALAAPTSKPASSLSHAELVERFAEPPADARILKIIHGWPDDAGAQEELIARLRRQGFGGVVCNVSFDQYLESEVKWKAFVRAVKAAREAGMALWLYDERGYPSGNAGGLVLRGHPEWEARGLLVADAESRGGQVELKVPPGKLVLAAAYPCRNGRLDFGDQINLSTNVQSGNLTWFAPTGQTWQVVLMTEDRLYEGTHAEMNLARKMPYPNLLMPEPTARFLEVTHQRYAEHLGNDLGRWFAATFTDEPSLMSCFIKPMPYGVLPWSPGFTAEFNRRRGYSIRPLLATLVADTGSRSRQVRHDFWRTVGELVSENYFGQIQSWCRQHGIPSGGHLLMEESLAAHVPLYGDFFRCARRLDAPGIDCLTSVPSEVPWHIARLLRSAAELEGRTIVMSETSDHSQRWRPPGDSRPQRQVTEAEIRGTCNRLMVSGVNRITSYYSFAGLDAAALRRLNEQVGRCGEVLTGGHQVADIAVVYPIESAWSRYTPSRHWARDAAEAGEVERVWRTAAESLFANGRDFTFVDGDTLSKAEVEDGALVHGRLRWRVVLLPMADTLPATAWNNLTRFVQDGGVLISMGALPANSEQEFPSARVQYQARTILGNVKDEPMVHAQPSGGAGVFLPRGSEGLLPLVLRGVMEPDVRIEPSGSPVRVTHRHRDGREFYFVVNDSSKPWEGRVEFSAGGESYRWDPASGNVQTNSQGSAVTLQLEPYRAVFFDFARWRLPREFRLRDGALPNLTVKPLATSEPVVARGEFVRAAVTREPASASGERPVWRATSRLTRGQVDTFLFLRFTPPEPVDLSETECLLFDTWVPAGQRTPNQLLVIVQEKGGGDFIAETARSLSTPGHARVVVPLDLFKHAGWSKDGDGEMDWGKVAEIRLGWGGYLGAEGETVEFSATQPQIGRVKLVNSR